MNELDRFKLMTVEKLLQAMNSKKGDSYYEGLRDAISIVEGVYKSDAIKPKKETKEEKDIEETMYRVVHAMADMKRGLSRALSELTVDEQVFVMRAIHGVGKNEAPD